MPTPDDEKRLNATSAVVCILAMVAGTVLLILGKPVETAMIPYALAFGVAALPQPIRSDK